MNFFLVTYYNMEKYRKRKIQTQSQQATHSKSSSTLHTLVAFQPLDCMRLHKWNRAACEPAPSQRLIGSETLRAPMLQVAFSVYKEHVIQ
jgi:hypothetical protein